MPGDGEGRQDAMDKLGHLAEDFERDGDHESANFANDVRSAIHEIPAITGDEAQGLVNDVRAGNRDHAEAVIDAADKRVPRPRPAPGPKGGG